MNVLIPLPSFDFELTEVAVPWKLFTQRGYKVTFSTYDSIEAKVDSKLITGVIFGQLKAKAEAQAMYREMILSQEFKKPIKYKDIDPSKYDLLHLPGGHAKGMRQYLESKILQSKTLEFYQSNKIIGAICHGSIVLARTINPENNKSIIYKNKISALTKPLEMFAYIITSWKLGKYYRTYPEYVEDEVKRNLYNPKQFKRGFINPFKPFVCIDQKLVTARWPEDTYWYTNALISKLES
ncbi:MAG: DJ-1/PfpI family protein [Flavobacteriaceae bacterium]|nr:DJ-1/PfpI family protein [Flavobacteriaceae bacterium]